MSMTVIIGFSIISAALIVLIKQYKPEFAVPLSVIATAIVLILTIVQSTDIITLIDQMTSQTSIDKGSIKLLIKALGICYITQLAADTCKDSGETSLASRVELAGKITVAVMSLPLITNVLDIIAKLLQ
ncbi:MAG: stage III sporulation protein AD [Clostridia bacterium]|nr:stage III sporulation protein AD [Clostridia bacterium]